MRALPSHPHPFFLEGASGRLFAVHHRPIDGVCRRGSVLVVPAFNEEMNRCRSMLTLQAQALARLGFGTLVLDLAGTGESDGHYGEARWDGWVDDVRRARDWLDGADGGGCAALLGVRLGVPLALDALAGTAACPLAAWQPVSDGRNYFTQFLRMRIAANMDRTDIPKDTTAGMRARLAEGASVEVAGYEVAPVLATAIESLNLATRVPQAGIPVAWFEKKTGEDAALPPASTQVVNAWRTSGVEVAVGVFDGPAFWALHDRHAAPDLIGLTAAWLDDVGRAA